MIEDIYKEQILEHYKEPRNFGKIENPSHHAREVNPLCGDNLELFLNVKDGRIVDVGFDGNGCAISKASCSMLTEKLRGMRIEDARKITSNDILKMLGIEISPARIKCALLSLKVLNSAIS